MILLPPDPLRFRLSQDISKSCLRSISPLSYRLMKPLIMLLVPSPCCLNTRHETMVPLLTLSPDATRLSLDPLGHSVCSSHQTSMCHLSIGGDLWASKFCLGLKAMKTVLKSLRSQVTQNGHPVVIWRMTQNLM